MSTSDELLRRVAREMMRQLSTAAGIDRDVTRSPEAERLIAHVAECVKREYETPTVEDVVALCTKSIADIETQRRQGGFDSKWLDGAVYAFKTTIHRITDRKRWAEKHAGVEREDAPMSAT